MNIRLEALQHLYRSPSGASHQVLNIPLWELHTGEQVLLRGVSGSGKTTLFNVLAGIRHPTSGEVWYDNIGLYQMTEAHRDRFRNQHIGYVFQNHHLIASLTVLENAMLPLNFNPKFPSNQRRQQAMSLLEPLGIHALAHYRPYQISTGQRLRVAVARALVNSPQVLIADEPTASLDADAARQVMDTLQRLCHAQSATLIVASHDPALEVRFPRIEQLQAGQLTLQKEPLSL